MLRAGAALAFAAAVLAPQTPLEVARADLDRRREALIRAYDLDAQRPRLDAYARTCVRAFRDPAIARREPIGRLPFVADNRREFLERTAAFVADRLGVRLATLTVKFSRLPKGTAGRVKLTDDRALVEVADRHRDDDEEILAIVAHEFAHILLEWPGSGVSATDANDEDLADAAVVMAGMGPLLLRAAYREGLSVSAGGKAEWSVRRTGSLHPVAIAYLTIVQAEMAGLSENAREGLVGHWLEKKKPEARSQKPEARSQKTEARSKKTLARVPSPPIPNPQSLDAPSFIPYPGSCTYNRSVSLEVRVKHAAAAAAVAALAAGIEPDRIGFGTVRVGDTGQGIAVRAGGLIPAGDLAVHSGFAAGNAPPAGRRVKIVIAGQ